MGLLPFVSVWKAAALALAELGCAAFFVVGVVLGTAGPGAPWFVLAACLFGVLVRAVDIESWALFIPGGLTGRTEQAFGEKAGPVVSTVTWLERLLLAALASAVLGRYIANVEELSATRDGARGLLWLQAQRSVELKPGTISKGVWLGISVVGVVAVWGLVAGLRAGTPVPLPPSPVTFRGPSSWLSYLAGFGVALPVLGTGSALARVAHQFAPPRVQSLRRTSALVVAFSFVGIAIPAFLFVMLVPGNE